MSYNSAQNQAWFARATLICTMKSTNYYPKVGTQITDLAWIESTLYCYKKTAIVSTESKPNAPAAANMAHEILGFFCEWYDPQPMKTRRFLTKVFVEDREVEVRFREH